MSSMVRTAEFVSGGHPDKFADQASDAVLDTMLDIAAEHGVAADTIRCAVETLAKENLVFVSGEIGAPRAVLADLDVDAVVQAAWRRAGYDNASKPTVINFIRPQSLEIAALVDGEGDAAGAGDQGIMWGHAFRETPTFMPAEYDAARRLIAKLDEVRASTLPYLRSDAKSQVSLAPDGAICSVIISTQHEAGIALSDLRHDIATQVVQPVLGELPPEIVKINHKGSFVLGGAAADCGLTGRKIVVDQFGPMAAVGGGAFSGKDPSKVDRSAAYMCRAIALSALQAEFTDAASASVHLSYGIGQVQPASIGGTLGDGRDIREWIRDTFADLSPRAIQHRLGLWERAGWTYADTASMGHYGRTLFPWERAI